MPVSPAVFVADHLRPAALKAGVQIPDGYRFGLHNMRHSLSHWLVNKAKVEPKTVQTIRPSCATHAFKRRWISTPKVTAMKPGLHKARS